MIPMIERERERHRIEDRHPAILPHPGFAVGRKPDVELRKLGHDRLCKGLLGVSIKITEGAVK